MGVVVDDEKLIARGEKDQSQRLITDIVPHISTRRTAVWACRSISSLANAILDAVPEGTLSNLFNAMYRPGFSLPDGFK
jgi:hypothetical protein